jgi:hypothetical protein
MQVSSQFHAPVDLPPVKSLPAHIGYEPGWALNRSGRCGAKNNLPCQDSNPGRSACNPSQYRLSYLYGQCVYMLYFGAWPLGYIWETCQNVGGQLLLLALREGGWRALKPCYDPYNPCLTKLMHPTKSTAHFVAAAQVWKHGQLKCMQHYFLMCNSCHK